MKIKNWTLIIDKTHKVYQNDKTGNAVTIIPMYWDNTDIWKTWVGFGDKTKVLVSNVTKEIAQKYAIDYMNTHPLGEAKIYTQF